MRDTETFVDYVYSFYGQGNLYADRFFNDGVTKHEIKLATALLVLNSPFGFDGDSFDREIVRDIMLYSRGCTDTEHKVSRFFN